MVVYQLYVMFIYLMKKLNVIIVSKEDIIIDIGNQVMEVLNMFENILNG